MTLRNHIYILLAVATVLFPLQTAAQQHDSAPKWEQTESAPSDAVRQSDQSPNVTVHDMYIYVELEQPAPVKLFTILGQPVTQMQLPAGTSRFRVAARGIYILKIGSITRRVTI